jgi:hypothetical protein
MGVKVIHFWSITLKLDLPIAQEVIGEIDPHGIPPDGGGAGMTMGSATTDPLDAIVGLAGSGGEQK